MKSGAFKNNFYNNPTMNQVKKTTSFSHFLKHIECMYVKRDRERECALYPEHAGKVFRETRSNGSARESNRRRSRSNINEIKLHSHSLNVNIHSPTPITTKLSTTLFPLHMFLLSFSNVTIFGYTVPQTPTLGMFSDKRSKHSKYYETC